MLSCISLALIVKENGVTIVIDSFSLNYVKGSKIDYLDSLEGSGFKIENPNQKSSCACGSSYET